jgi:hypothetical protein
MVQETVENEGEAIPVPRAGDLVNRGDESLPVESVTWEFQDGGLVLVTLAVGDRPYTY